MTKHAGADGNCPDYGNRLDPCPPGCESGTCVYAAPPGQRVSDGRITDHAYDCGPDEVTGGPCVATVNASGGAYEGTEECGAPRDQHKRTEYDAGWGGWAPGQEVHAKGCSGEHNDRGGCKYPPGDMHEPEPYTGELDWHDSIADRD